MPTPTGIRPLLDGLDNQLASQHTAIIAKLDALLAAFGVAIPTDNITLANIDSRLLTITTLLNSDLDTMQTELHQIYLLLANSIAPNLENVFFSLNDLYALQASIGSTAPRLPALPSVVNLPTGAELLHCQRVQWMIDEFFSNWMGTISTQLGALGGVGVALVLAALPVPALEGAAIPLALLSSGAYALLQVLNLGTIASAATTAKKNALRQALYAATNAQAAQPAWNTTVDGFSDTDGSIRTVWKTLIWSDWFNHLYDAVNHNATTEPGKWDLDGYDGSVCAPAGSFPSSGSIRSTAVFITGYTNRQCIVWPNGAEFTDWVGYHYNGNVGNPVNPYGKRFTISDTTSGAIRFVPLGAGSADPEIRNLGSGSTYTPSPTWATGGFYADTFDDNVPFTVSWVTL